MTKVWRMTKKASDKDAIREAAALLREGKQVAFPTETVYGLGADARNTAAVEGIFTAKGRPSDNPLIVHIAQEKQLDEVALYVDEISLRLARRFWPGPLTLVLPVRKGAVSEKVTAGLSTVAVRMPDHPAALALIREAGCPVAAPSANRSGRPSPTLAEHVLEDLAGRIAGVIDGGPTGVGLESTVVEVDQEGRVHVLRPGGITPLELEQAAGRKVLLDTADESGRSDESHPKGQLKAIAAPEGHEDEVFRPKAPGMKYTHYAPKGRLTVVEGTNADTVYSRIMKEEAAARAAGERTGILAPIEHAAWYQADLVVPCGSLQEPDSAARELFAALRRFDEEGVTLIFAEAYPKEGIGLAVMNRLMKAAGHRLIRV